MTEKFAVGDLVKLKSGGHIMTVEKVDGDSITCVWTVGKKSYRDTFAAGTLKKVGGGVVGKVGVRHFP